jgi:hypothetical protein
LTIRPDLAEKILTLQFSFELQHCTQGFWLGFRSQLPRMTALQNLSITYSHQDEDCLHRILDHGNLAALLPPSVQTLHLKPLYQLIYQEVSFRFPPMRSHSFQLVLCFKGPRGLGGSFSR